MPPRQLWLFKFGCWVACGTAALHLAASLLALTAAPGTSHVEGLEAAAGFRVVFPDGTERTLGDLLLGFGLAHALLLGAVGALGLTAARRGRDNGVLMADVARVQALVSLALLTISLTHFFLVPTLLVAVMLICFTLAAVRAPVGH